MQKQSNNVVYSQNLAVLTAAAELGAEAIARSVGSNEAANTLEGERVTMSDIKSALVARMLKHLAY